MAEADNGADLLIDVSRLLWRRWSGTRATGIDRICQAWLEHYAPRSQAVIIHRRAKAILPEHTSQALFRFLLRPERSRRDVAQFRRNILGLGLRQGRYLRDRLQGKGRIWLNPGHTGLDVPGVEDWCKRRELRPVYLIHDLIPITHPQYCREGEEERHRERMRTALATAAGVIANSEHTLQSFRDFARSEGAALSPATVAWPGTPILPRSKAVAGRCPTFVVLGTIEGRKNHKLLLSVWRKLLEDSAARHGTVEVPRLVIVGRRGWQANDVFDQLDHVDFQGRVSEVGALDDVALADVFKNARALLFPSVAEGFGIPLIEALAAEVPVIASDLAVFREIGQGVPEFLPADDEAAWRRAIIEYALPASTRRTQQFERLTQFQPPNWERHFAIINRFLASLPG